MEHYVDLADIQSELEGLVAAQSSFPVQLIIVPDIDEWAQTNAPQLPSSRWGLAIKDHSTRAAAIIVRQRFTKEQADTVVGRVAFSGVPNAFELLAAPKQFARHLVLHELAHLENDWGQEREAECDRWAAERLPDGA
ncbi:MAG: hypothetical protein V4673_14065 [Pseudomonadota bacterium]